MRAIGALVMALALSVAAAAAAEIAIPNSIADVKQGEWVLMEDVSSSGAGERVKVTVTAVAGDNITLRRERLNAEGAVTETKETEVPLSRMTSHFTEIKKRATSVTNEFVMVGDKEIPVVVVQWQGENKDGEGNPHEYKMWLSNDIPLTGVAKFWSSDTSIPHSEILEYGTDAK